jgi:hypothetical protein
LTWLVGETWSAATRSCRASPGCAALSEDATAAILYDRLTCPWALALPYCRQANRPIAIARTTATARPWRRMTLVLRLRALLAASRQSDAGTISLFAAALLAFSVSAAGTITRESFPSAASLPS